MTEIPADHPAVAAALAALSEDGACISWAEDTVTMREAMAAALTAALPHLTGDDLTFTVRRPSVEAERDRAIEALREIAALRLTAGVYRIAHTALRDLGADE